MKATTLIWILLGIPADQKPTEEKIAERDKAISAALAADAAAWRKEGKGRTALPFTQAAHACWLENLLAGNRPVFPGVKAADGKPEVKPVYFDDLKLWERRLALNLLVNASQFAQEAKLRIETSAEVA